jgi:hypothetical protein
MRAHLVLQPLERGTRRARCGAARAAFAEALRASAARAAAPAGLPCAAWPRGPGGAPLAVDGWHASVADAPGLVVALVAPVPVGVDVEWLARPRWHAARARFESSGEKTRLGGDGRADVLALWSAKEACLKLAGVGLAELARCPLVSRAGERFLLEHRGARHEVRVRTLGEHVVAWTAAAPLALVWDVPEAVA